MINELIAWFIRLYKQKKGHGFNPKKIKIEADHYQQGDGQLEVRLGGEPPIIWADGQQDADLPVVELQTVPYETWHCTVFGTENAIQTIMKKVYGIFKEYTERYTGVLAGITKGGGSPHNVAEAIRKYWMLPYKHLPFEEAKNWEEFNSPKPMTQSLIDIAKSDGENWIFGHDWVWEFSHDNIKDLLKRYTLAVGVYAWTQENGVYVKPSWAKDNHWVQIYGYVEGKYWKVYDHYDNVHKKLDWNYPFSFMKRYTLVKKNIDQAGKDLYDRFKSYDAIQVFPSGAVYTIGEFIKHELWYAEKEGYLQKKVKAGLLLDYEAGKIIPITQEQFDTMMKYAKLAGIEVKEDKDNLKAINKLKE